MSSAPSTPHLTTINITDVTELTERSSSTLDQLQESPSFSVSTRSAPDTHHGDDYYDDILATINNTEIIVNHSSPSLQQTDSPDTPTLRNTQSNTIDHKKRSKKARRSRHKKTTSLSFADTPNGIVKLAKKRLKPKPLKKAHKSVGFADCEHKQKRKKGRIKKRKSVTPSKILEKDLEKYLSSMNQYLLPVPRKKAYYKWAILDPSTMKSKCKKSGGLAELLESLNVEICASTANIALIQSNDLLICLSNISSSAPILVRTHCAHSTESIRKYFRSVCNISIPIRSYQSKLDSSSLADLLSSAREEKFLKAHKSRSEKKGHGIPRKITKNTRWELDLSHPDTIEVMNRLHDVSDSSVDWVIFDFADARKNTKYLVISSGEYGAGGSEALSGKLAQIDEMRYAVLVVVYGHIVKHRLILLIIWNPMNAMAKKQLTVNATRERAHSTQNTMTFWQHKEKIRCFAAAKKEMNINLHSKLAESMIISSLHRDGLIDDILIRVTQTEGIHPVQPTAVPRQWTLRQLKEKLSTDYDILDENIRISLVPNNVGKRKKSIGRARTRTQSEIGWLTDDSKTLFDLGIDHGSQIYIHDIGNTEVITNALIKRDRLRGWQLLFNTQHLTLHKDNHRRERSMPNVHIDHAQIITNYHTKQKTSTPKLSLSFNMKTTMKRKKKKTKKKRKTKKKEETLEPYHTFGYLPEICESNTASTPPIIHMTKSLSLPKHVQNIDQSVSSITTDEDFDSPQELIIKSETAPIPAPSSSSSNDIALQPSASAPAPIPAPVPAPLPLHFIGGSMVTQTYPISSSAPPPPVPPPHTKKKRKLKTNLDELQASIDAKREAEAKERECEEEEEALQPSHVFTDLELEFAAKRASQSAPALTNRRSFDLTGEEEALIPLPDTIKVEVETENNIDLNDLFITSHNIGRGKTATVHQALYKNTVFVALKEFVFRNLSPAILADFHKEANTLAALRHPNIAQLVGSYLDDVSGELYLVLEWLPNGCLHDLLHKKEQMSFEMSYYDVLLMAIDIARGMKYLHCKNMIHRDLKTHNLLLDEEYRVKVTDFGTAKHLEQVFSKAFTEVGTLGYVAPEVLDPPINGYDGKVDVFSYAVILWEIYSSYAKIATDNVLTTVSTLQYAQRLKNGFRPKIPSDCPQQFRFLIDQCWQYKPQKRPTFAQIVLYLQRCIKQLQQEQDDDDDDDEDEYEYEEDEDYDYEYEYEDD
eukprot:859427_1